MRPIENSPEEGGWYTECASCEEVIGPFRSAQEAEETYLCQPCVAREEDEAEEDRAERAREDAYWHMINQKIDEARGK